MLQFLVCMRGVCHTTTRMHQTVGEDAFRGISPIPLSGMGQHRHWFLPPTELAMASNLIARASKLDSDGCLQFFLGKARGLVPKLRLTSASAWPNFSFLCGRSTSFEACPTQIGWWMSAEEPRVISERFGDSLTGLMTRKVLH